MSSERLALIGKTINAEVAAGRIPGAVLAVARRGKLVYFEAFGYRDQAAGAPMTTDAIFSIASMTKPMVAVAALQLYEQGRLLRSSRTIFCSRWRPILGNAAISKPASPTTSPASPPTRWNATMLPEIPDGFAEVFTGAELAVHIGARRV